MLPELLDVCQKYLTISVTVNNETKTYCNFVLHGEYKRTLPDGVLLAKGNYRYGKKHGKWEEWSVLGRKILEENYHNGIQHGEYMTWFDNGSYKTCSKNGRVDGVTMEMCGGVKIMEYTSVNNKRHGDYTEWYENGKIKYKSKYINGVEDNSVAWHENGQIMETQNKVNGIVRVNKYSEIGVLHSAYGIDRVGFHGLHLIYHENGQIWKSTYYIDNIINGPYKLFSENGKLTYNVTYINGLKHGKALVVEADETYVEIYSYNKLLSRSKLT